MAEDVRGVSPDVLAAGVFGIAGSIIGALFGVVAATLMRSGRLRCEASFLPPPMLTGVEREAGYPRSYRLDEADAAEATGVFCRFTVELFNGTERPTALGGPRAVFVAADGARYFSPVRLERGGELDVINLEPRRIERLTLEGEFGARGVAEALQAGSWKRIMFEAQRPARPLLWRRAYRKTIVKPPLEN